MPRWERCAACLVKASLVPSACSNTCCWRGGQRLLPLPGDLWLLSISERLLPVLLLPGSWVCANPRSAAPRGAAGTRLRGAPAAGAGVCAGCPAL